MDPMTMTTSVLSLDLLSLSLDLLSLLLDVLSLSLDPLFFVGSVSLSLDQLSLNTIQRLGQLIQRQRNRSNKKAMDPMTTTTDPKTMYPKTTYPITRNAFCNYGLLSGVSLFLRRSHVVYTVSSNRKLIHFEKKLYYRTQF